MIRPRATFVTTTLGTPWEPVSQALLEYSFAGWPRLLVDGTTNWRPLGFLDVLKVVETDYLIHVDEDCFLFEGRQLEELIRKLDESPEVAVCGSPDGGTFHRDHNPCACNPFFLILRKSSVANLPTSEAEWQGRPWREGYRALAGCPLEELDRTRIQFDTFESFYPYFWSILEAGLKILYLVPSLNKDLLASELRANAEEERPMALHMWWLRNWADKRTEPYLGVSHRSRYERFRVSLAAGLARDAAFAQALRREWRRHLARRLWRLLRRPKAGFW